ncbi:MAG: alpha/beta fold hydrolase [Rhodobacteraceae bacterium]|nr:alpha/beta fold hydrolase [Paracoccaceae bacterium]
MTGPAIPGLTRHFVTLGNRQVHYRRMGSGPALLALHRLPRSSADLIPFMQDVADRFTVIAPDFAGYGNSWQLAQTAYPEHGRNVEMVDYVDDIVAFLNELGVKSCAVYGEHFGATAALQLIIRDPKRISAATLNGLTVALTEDERAAARDAHAPFVPSWDGSHLAWLWAWLREETRFHPWWVKNLAARLADGMPTNDSLHRRAVQFLADGRGPPGPGGHPFSGTTGRQGRGYAAGLLAALEFRPRAHLVNVAVPTLITGSPAFAAMLKDTNGAPKSGKVKVEKADSRAAARDKAVAFLTENIGRTPVPPPPQPPQPIKGVLWQSFVDIPGGQLHFQANDDLSTVPVLIQHDAASSVGTVEPITASLIGRRTVLAFDLPGSGESDNTLDTGNLDIDTLEVEAYAASIKAALDALGLEQIDFYGMWGGGFVGLDLARMEKTPVRRLVMSNVFQHDGEEQKSFQANYTPLIEPAWHGGHLMQAWHEMRDQGLFYPWFDTSAAGVIKREPFIATDMVHERVCSLLKAGNMYRAAYQAHFRYRTYEKLRGSPVPTLLATTKWDPNNPHTQAAAKAAPNAQLRYLDDDFKKWGLSFLDFLEAP